ncbi:MAG: T9SS type A sorting domain-containing protein [Flavipsychrobacter sp.]|nr:T9SS type A sorting domain-containing protein [Flavipsychrobacter sp.]
MKYPLLFLFIISLQSAFAQNTVEKFDILPGTESSNPLSLTEYNGRLYFYATDSSLNQQIWSTDGINPPIRSIVVGPGKGLHWHLMYSNDILRYMAVLNGKLYFTAKDSGSSVSKIYSYDGTNIALATEVIPGGTFPQPSLFLAFNNKLYFRAYDSNKNQLYAFDPSNNITTRITNLNDTLTNGGIRDVFIFKNKLIIQTGKKLPSFLNYNKLYEYDPANNTTTPILTNYTFDNIDYYTIMNDTLILATGTSEPVLFPKNSGTLYYYTGTGSVQKFNRVDNVYHTSGFQQVDEKIFYYGTYQNDSSLSWYDTRTEYDRFIYDANGNSIKHCYWFKKHLGSIIFCSKDSMHQYNRAKLWALNGINPPILLTDKVVSRSDEHITFKGSLYYICSDDTIGYELAKYTNSKLSVANTSALITAATHYPNPAKNYTNIELKLSQSQALSISITDMQGRIVYHLPLQHYTAAVHSIRIPMQSLVSGIYNYAINNGSAKLMAYGKIVKE